MQLQAVDVLVVLKLAALKGRQMSLRRLEKELGVKKSTIGNALKRLEKSGLAFRSEGEWRVNRLALREFLEHGIRYVFPGEVGRVTRGIATAHSAEPLAGEFLADPEPLVIAFAGGKAQGRSLRAVHPRAVAVANRDPEFYRLLCLTDAFRVGRARDRQIASKALSQCLYQ